MAEIVQTRCSARSRATTLTERGEKRRDAAGLQAARGRGARPTRSSPARPTSPTRWSTRCCPRSSSATSSRSRSSGRSSRSTDEEVEERAEAARPRTPAPSSPKDGHGRDRRPRDASPTSARSTASRSRAAATTTPSFAIGTASSFRASPSSSSASRPASEKTITVTFPEDYRRSALAGKDGDVRRHGEGGRLAATRSPIDDQLAERLGVESLAAAPRRPFASSSRRSTPMATPAEGQAPAPRPARRDAPVRAAARDGRPGVRDDLAPDHRRARPGPAGPSRTRARPRRRPAPTIARSPSAGCGSAWSCPRSARATRSR